ncbi:APC amino acid permease [Agrocybe pediades]|nr:APC amino acid permease [Agrocybe pediades]
MSDVDKRINATSVVPAHDNSILVDKDARLLAELGYKQEFRRNFSPIELFGIGFSIIGLVPSIASVLVFSVPYGGTHSMVWGWAVCGVFLTIIALAMGELGSAAPTSGGLYYWTFRFSSPKWRCLLSWIVGYANSVGNMAGLASIDWGCAVQIMAAASIGSGIKFQPTAGQTYAVYCALLLFHGAMCSTSPVLIARLQKPYIILNLLLCVALIVALPAATPSEFKNNAKEVFGTFINISGWNNGFAFIIGFLSPLWVIGAFDSVVHVSEEATNAAVAIPFAIILSAVSSIIIGWGIMIVLAFNMGKSPAAVLDSPIGQPLATIFFNSFGQKGTLALWAVIIVVQFTMGSSILTACSRQIFAFSRDGGLPFSGWLYNVNQRTHAPVHAVWFSVLGAALLGLLGFAGPNAIGAVFALGVTGQYVAYSIPITARYFGGQEIKPGPFTLGFMSAPIAAVAVVFMSFMTLVFMFPAIPNPSASDMNYTSVVMGGTLVLCVIYYYFPKYGGVYWFKGPIRTLELELGSEDSASAEVQIVEEGKEKSSKVSSET